MGWSGALPFLSRAVAASAMAVLLGGAVEAATPLAGATAVSAGVSHACAVVNGGVKCWGGNSDGQLGVEPIGTTSALAVDVATLPAGSGVTDVAAGDSHTCAIVDGGVQCWGRNAEGQLGRPFGMSTAAPDWVDGLGPGSNVTAIAAGVFYSCAVANGGVLCWGGNYMSVWPDQHAPSWAIAPGSNAVDVDAGFAHACAAVNGGAQCWGWNVVGQLGDGTIADSVAPVAALPPLSGVTAVDAGYDHGCATVNGGLRCWGADSVGQLGDGAPGWDQQAQLPADALGLGSPLGEATAGPGTTCAVVTGGVRCWGSNLFGQLGAGTSGLNTDSAAPTWVTGLGAGAGASRVSAGDYFSCAVVNGGVWCWGLNYFGNLGGGTDAALSAVPVAVVVDAPAANTAPDLGPVAVAPATVVAAGTIVTASAAFVDPDAGDVHACTIAWGDGLTDASPALNNACAGSHGYTTPGVYLVTIAVADQAGASDGSQHAYVVVYDPTAGFVTGGGWFESPAGAYRLDEAAAGRARFGFVAKYQKGRAAPDGHTEFQFAAAGFSFASSSYEWLVVAGGKAMYRGAGTVNGGGDYQFQLSAVDGQLTGGGADLFRMRVWDRATGGLVYDNQTCGAADASADPCTVIAGGQIVIHGR